jgi:hypothetical protein
MPDPVVTHAWTDTGTGAGNVWTFNSGGAAWTPVAGDAYALLVMSAGATGNPTTDATTMDGSANGLTLALVGSSQFSASPIINVAVYSAQPAGTPASGSIVGTWADSQGGVIAIMLKVDNPGNWGALADGLIQAITFADSDPNTVANQTVTQAAAAQANSVFVAAFFSNINGQIDPSDASFTELTDVTIASGRNRTAEVMWRANDDDLSANGISKNTGGTATNAKMLGVIFELVNVTPPLTAVGKSLAASWSVRAPVTRSLQAAWDVEQLGVSPSPTVTWWLNDSSTGAVSTAAIDNAGADVTPDAGKGVILVLLSGGTTTPAAGALLPDTVDGSDMGLDFLLDGWTEWSASPTVILSVWSALPPASPSAGKVNVTWAANQGGWQATLLKVEDPADYGPWLQGMAEYIGFADSDPNTVANLSVSKPFDALTGSVMLAGFASNKKGGITPSDASFTELSDFTIATGRNRTLETMWRAASDDVSANGVSYNTTPAATNAKMAGFIVELLRADPPVTAVGRSLVAIWNVEVEDPPETTTLQVIMRGAVTAAEIGLDGEEPDTGAPEEYLKVGGVWVLIAGAVAPGA